MSFSAAEENFHNGAKHGIDAQLYWPGLGSVPAAELVLRRLLPMADEGLAAWGVSTEERDRFLGIIEQRCKSGRNGASWQADAFHDVYDGSGMSRLDAMREVVTRYRGHMHSNEPVHSWPVS